MRRRWLALILVPLLGVLAWLAYERVARSGRIVLKPVAVGSFADQAWRARWATREGEFKPKGDRWVGEGALANIAVLREPCAGATAIEFDGEVQHGSVACDLSALWYEDVTFSADGTHATGAPALKFQVGAYDNSFSCIFTGDNEAIAVNRFTLEVGRRYHVRAEIIYDLVRLLVDGQVLCEYRMPLPMASGYWALYSYYPGKAFSAVTVSSQAFSSLLPATAVADNLAAHGLYAAAGRAYISVANGEGEGMSAELARLHGALCLDRANQLGEADAAWKLVAQGPYAGRAKLNALERRARAGEPVTTLLGELTAIQGTGDAAFRSDCARVWEHWLNHLLGGPHTTADVDAFIVAWRAWAHQEPLVERQVVECLLRLHREQEILDTFTHHRTATIRAMLHMGRGYEALAHCPDRSADRASVLVALGRYDEAIPQASQWNVPWILLEAGRYDEIERDFPGYHAAIAESLQRQGRNQEVLDRFPDAGPLPTARALCAVGRGAEALTLAELTHAMRREVLVRLGRLDEAAALTVADPLQDQTLDACRAWEALAAGDVARAEELLRPRCRWIFDVHDQGLLRWLVGPCALALGGSRDGLVARLEAGRAEVGGNYRGILGRQIDAVLGQLPADDADLHQPKRSWLLVTAIKAELDGDAATAATQYAAYVRDDADADPALTRFAAWRLADALSPTVRPSAR